MAEAHSAILEGKRNDVSELPSRLQTGLSDGRTVSAMRLKFESMSMEELARLTSAQRLARRAKLDTFADYLDKLPEIAPGYWRVLDEIMKLQSNKWPENGRAARQ